MLTEFKQIALQASSLLPEQHTLSDSPESYLERDCVLECPSVQADNGG